ncbi:MAG: ABC transporter permease [Clostridiales bacterium]|nr:ABC transporter permease [Clostridiales bacterium]
MKLNKPLILGSVILSILLIVVLIPGILTDKDPYSVQTLKYTIENVDGENVFLSAPFAPSQRNKWGTDELGRDLFSFIIYGTRLTLKIALWVTLFRFLLAIPLGLFSGFNYSVPQNIIRQVNILFSGLPPLLFAVFVLYLNVFTRLDKRLSTIAFIAVLTLVGFGKLAQALEETTKTVLSKPFITSEYLLGKSKFEVAIENVVPHIMPEIVVLFFMEIARVLSLQIQLGLFSIFIGNLKILLASTQGGSFYWNVSFEPEWASLLGYATVRLRTSPWMVLYPAGAFFVSVLGFNMFGEGLRIKLQDDQTQFVPKVRKAVSFLFLRKHRQNPVHSKKWMISGMVLVLLVAFVVIDFGDSGLGDEIYFTEEMLPERLYVGMDEVNDVTDLLAQEMMKNGFQPVYDEFKQSYEVEPNYYVKESLLKINDVVYVQDMGYVMMSFNDVEEISLPVLDARDISLYNVDNYTEFQDKAVWIDINYYNHEAIEAFSSQLASAGCKALLVTGHDKKVSIGSFVSHVPYIGLGNDVELKDGDTITINSHVSLLSDKGINVVGMIEGKDQNISQEVIVLGVPLNYRSKEYAVLTYNYVFEIMKKIQPISNRTVVLAFFDGTYKNDNHGILRFSKGMKFDPYMHIEYFSLRTLEYGTDPVIINKDQSPDGKYFGVSFFQSLENTALQYEFVREQVPENVSDLLKHPDFVMHHKKGIDTIIFDVYSDADVFYESFYKALKENN